MEGLATVTIFSGKAMKSKTSTRLEFSDMPCEIHLKIFSYLSKSDMATAARVCKSWKVKIYDPSLWKQVTFPELKDSEHVDAAVKVLKRATMLRTLAMRNIFNECILARIPHYPSLKSLDLSHLRYSNISYSDELLVLFITSIIAKCPFIETLNLEGCTRVTDEVVFAVGELQYLKDLNVANCERVTSSAIISLVQRRTMLEVLNIDGITKLNDRAICAVGTNLHKTLKSLLIDGEGITDKSFKELQNCKHLTSLLIRYADSITDASLLYIQNLTQLTSLRIRHGKNLTSTAISNFFIGPHMKNLQSIEFKKLSIDDGGVRNLVTCCLNLKALSLRWCWYVTDVGVQAIVSDCRSLEHLNLTGLFRLAGECLSDVPHNLPGLKQLKLDRCDRIPFSVLENLHKSMPSLKIIHKCGRVVSGTRASQ